MGIFETLPDWEIINPFYKNLHGEDVRNYPLVYLSLNTMFYILDLLVNKDEEEDQDGRTWYTYFIDDIDIVLQFINSKNACRSVLSLFVPRSMHSNEDYSIHKIRKIYEGLDSLDQHIKLYECKNGKSFYSFGYLEEGDKIKNKKLIFQQK